MRQEDQFNNITANGNLHTPTSVCICCGNKKAEVECQECSHLACEGWFGNCCNCGNDYVISMVD